MSASRFSCSCDLINTAEIELWPARRLRVRSNAHARMQADAAWLLRRKYDGRYLASVTNGGLLQAWIPRLTNEPGIEQIIEQVDMSNRIIVGPYRASRRVLPLTSRLRERVRRLNIDVDAYRRQHRLNWVLEPMRLTFAGLDRFRRPLWLVSEAARAWRFMRRQARSEGVILQAISGYRSHHYQAGIIERKLARGQALTEILKVSAAPGFSEHHSGCALDIGAPDSPPLEEDFEESPAFEWLTAHAARFGFCMSFPRDNEHGVVYEPWHWCYCHAST